jgi:hypothetical protein
MMAALVSTIATGTIAPSWTAIAIAQELPPAQNAPTSPSYPACPPPNATEFLLLIPSKTPESQAQIRQTLPASSAPTVCLYGSDVVTRGGGFPTIDNANAWARYVKEMTGLTATIARPAQATAAPTPVAPPKAPTQPTAASTLAYNPQPMGAGYAVLVDFFNQPELVAKVQQVVGGNVGLVSYGQRPYLLAVYTADQTAAGSTLQALVNQGLWAMVVDSRRVTLLRSAIDIQRVVGR